MTETTTGYLADGRTVPVPEDAVKDWKYEIENGDTTLGLGDWYTDCGDENMDQVEGSPDDHPRCGHEGREVRVTNASQKDEYDQGRPHASAWVCRERACVLDAMAWVERATGEHAVWQARGESVWRSLPPHWEPLSGESLALPLDQAAARSLGADPSGYATFVVELDTNAVADAYASGDETWDHHDLAHAAALSFGSPYGSTVEVVASDGESGLSTVRYTTSLEEALEQAAE